MMEITHHTRSIRIAPRKLRLIVDKIRHLTVDQALATLPLVPNRGANPIYKAIKAAASAASDANLDPTTLVIQRAWADEGPALKRVIRFGRGRSSTIMKKYSHIGLVIKGQERKSRRTKAAAAAQTAEIPAEASDSSHEITK